MQLIVEASDQAVPRAQKTTTQVTVTVPRDQLVPQFEQTQYNVTLAEDESIGSDVVDIRARDDELRVSLSPFSFFCIN